MCKQAYTFRLYPTKKQVHVLTSTLERCRELYNAALQERRDAYRMVGKHINYYEQANQLPEIKEIREEYRDIHSQVLQDVLRKADKAFKAFFTRCKRGTTPGFPRYKGKGHFDSFTYPQGGYSLSLSPRQESHDHRVCLSKIGFLKVKLYREIKGTIKTCTIKREGDCWYIVFACEVEQEPLEASDKAVGIDLGLLHFAPLSDGSTIENPRYYRKAEKKLERLQQALSRKKRGSHRRKKAVKQVAKGGLNKSIVDAGWNMFQQFCTYTAEKADRTVLLVNPKYTSQICSGCGTVRKKELSERWHSCECGCELDRDHNAAINILRLGRSQQGAIPVEAPCL